MSGSNDAYHCPVCANESVLGSPSFPFCCTRCKMVDLGAWMDGSYTISQTVDPIDSESFDPEYERE